MRSRPQDGFTLVELLVALALGTLVMTFVFKTFISTQKATTRVSEQIEDRQNSRTAVQLLERDLRMAGSGWSKVVVEGGFKGAPIQVQSVTPGYGGSDTANDTLGMLGAWDLATTLRVQMVASTDNIKVTSSAGFNVNDFVVVAAGQNAHLFQVTAVTGGSTPSLTKATTSFYNATGGHTNWPLAGYPVGTPVYRVSWVSYFVDASRTPAKLMRREDGMSDQVVAVDLSKFQVSYRLEDDTVTRNPDDPSMIEQLIPVVKTQISIPGRPALLDSASVTIHPRSF